MHQPNDDNEIISGINVTPLVDIMLVLLIIFMLVSTFVDFTAIKVELPRAATGEALHTETVSVMISKEGEYYISGKKIPSFKLVGVFLREKKKENPDIQVIISADKKVYHEKVVGLIDLIRKAGILKFAINVELIDEPGNG
ncbi:MAG: biopolymer transporter ExbD [Proteobacteria bacterium]|nr:biopolymer transporter ExbD [Pseudomonadota bacterium]